MDTETARRLDMLARRLRSASVSSRPPGTEALGEALIARAEAVTTAVRRTLEGCDAEQIARVFLGWMREGAVVRVLGAGRARLAAAISANRLAHGGARVSIQNDLGPMPSSLQGGGAIAASSSGRTRSVLEALRELRSKAPHVTVVGIARPEAHAFHELCHWSIAIQEAAPPTGTLHALSDVGELAIAEVLDALVVAAGHLGGFDDRKWRFGHEDIAETGPYSARDADD